MIFLYALAALLLLISGLLFIPINLGIDYVCKDKKQTVRLVFKVLGIPFSYRLKNVKSDEEKAEKDVEKDAEEIEEGMTLKKFKAYIHAFHDGFDEAKQQICVILKYPVEKFRFTKMHMTVSFGMKSPASTGMMTGAVWTAGTNLLSFIDRNMGIDDIKMNVYPDFQQEVFNIHILSILRLKIFQLLIIALKGIKIYNIFKEKIDLNLKGGV